MEAEEEEEFDPNNIKIPQKIEIASFTTDKADEILGCCIKSEI